MKKVLAGILCAVMAMAACGCGSEDSSSKAESAAAAESAAESTAESSAEESTAEVSESAAEESEEDSPYTLNGDFSKGKDEVKWMASDGWTNGNMFNCTWSGSCAVFEDSLLKLKIDSDPWGDGYLGGEYRTNDFYGYGLYEVSMKPIKNKGVVSSFFTYTGPSDNNPWDEIDIEFLGKDTTKVQFNYFTDGKGSHEKLYDLGFDASEDFHTYGFRWAKDSITWYVDGKEVHKADKSIPVTPSKIMMNVWNGTGVDGWLDKYDGTTPLTAEYQWARFTAE